MTTPKATPPSLVKVFPWQRLTLTICSMASILLAAQKYVDWIYYFAILDPKETSGAMAITALSYGVGVLFVCFSAINIWFITGSVKTIEAMFAFNASTVATAAVTATSSVVHQVIQNVVDETSGKRKPFSQEAKK